MDIVAIIVVGLAIDLFVALIVYRDAYVNYDENAGWWGLGTFLLPIIGLALYLYHRTYGNTPRREMKAWTGTCKYCDKAIPPQSSFCPYCDRAQV